MSFNLGKILTKQNGGLILNEYYLELAQAKVEDPRLLVNGVSARAKELARGGHPLVAITPGEPVDWLDVALREVAEGKVRILAADS